ncbi:MAG: hypothetical protein AAF411_23515 [Myxococcota bacterium]
MRVACLSVGLSVLVAFNAWGFASAQRRSDDALRAAIAADPSNAAARCELAFRLVRAERYDDARAVAEPAIPLLGSEQGRRGRRRMGACLYTLGRAHEGLAEPSAAAAHYVQSLRVRDHATVRTRLQSIVTTEVESPLGAMAAAAFDADSATAAERSLLVVEEARATLGDAELTVTGLHYDDDGAMRVDAYAAACGRVQSTTIDAYSYDNTAWIRLSEPRVMRVGGQDAVVVRLQGGGDDNCGGRDAMSEYERSVTLLLYVDGCRIRHARLRESHRECDLAVSTEFRLTPEAIIIDAARGEGARRPGAYTLRQLTR